MKNIITFTKSKDLDFATYYKVRVNGKYVDYFGVAYDSEFWGKGWTNGRADISDLIGHQNGYQLMKKAFRKAFQNMDAETVSKYIQE